MLDLEVIDEPAAATAALDPLRTRILRALAEPASATTVASALGESRQKVNYHMRTLEAHGLIELVEERPRRGLTERVMAASARTYEVSVATGTAGHDTSVPPDRWSARYLVAVGARMVREVAELARRADDAGREPATLAIDTELRFASAADRAAFTDDLAQAVTNLAAKYHDETAPHGRWHRLVVAAHPRPAPSTTDSEPGRTP